MDLYVRPATPDDASELLEMIEQLHSHESLPTPGAGVRLALRRLLDEPALGRVLVAQKGSALAGYCVLGFGYSLEFHGRDAFVDELFVAEAHRSLGVGSLLLDAAEEACRAAGVKAIHLESDHANLRATDLYRRRGFTSHTRHLMTKWLDRPGS